MSKRKGEKAGNCLYFLFVFPFVIIFQLYALLFKGLVWLFKIATATPESRRVSLIAVGAFFAVGLVGSAVSAIMDLGQPPALDPKFVQETAVADAWLSYTQTVQASITDTPLPTATWLPTETPLLTETTSPLPTATFIVFSTSTPFIVIAQPTSPPISGGCSCGSDTMNCSDFSSWSAAQACYTSCLAAGAGDIHRLDGNNDGSACDSLK